MRFEGEREVTLTRLRLGTNCLELESITWNKSKLLGIRVNYLELESITWN